MTDLLAASEIEALQVANQHASSYRRAENTRSIPPSQTASEAHEIFGGALNDEGQDADQVLRDIIAKSDGGILDFTSPRFFGFVIGGSHPVGVAADHLVSAWGNPSSYAELTPGVTAMENQMTTWIADLLGLPDNCGAGIVTGATMANTIAIMAARNALLAREGWNVEDQGLFGAPEINVVLGDEAHSAVFAGLRYAGFGAKRVTRVPADAEGRMIATELDRALNALTGPTLVIVQAGNVNSGASDPFAEIIPIARKHKAWVHVDGAFGLWLAASPDTRAIVAGVAEADSWAVDLHKWLQAPYDSAIAFVRDKARLATAMSAKGAYLPDEGTFPDPSDFVTELSRRARGVPSYAILRTLGKSGVSQMIARHCVLAKHLARLISAEPGLTVLNQVVANQVVITCGEGEKGDAQTQATLAKVQENGKVYPTHGNWRDRTIIRCSICNYATRQNDVDLLAEEIITAWRDVNAA